MRTLIRMGSGVGVGGLSHQHVDEDAHLSAVRSTLLGGSDPTGSFYLSVVKRSSHVSFKDRE